MIDDQSSEFKFNGDETDEASLYQEEQRDLRIEKLSHRVTFITILVPLLIGIFLYFGYRDLTGRVSQTQDSGLQEVQNLSKDMQDKYKALSDQFAALEAALMKRIAIIDKDTDELQKELNQTENKLQSTSENLNKEIAAKADKSDQSQAIQKLDKQLDPIRKQLETITSLQNNIAALSAEIQSMETNLNDAIATVAGEVDRVVDDLASVRSNLETLSNGAIDRSFVELELLKAKKDYQQSLDLTTTYLEKRMAAIQKKIEELEKVSQLYEQRQKPAQQESSTKSTTTSSLKPTNGQSSITPGQIREQDLKE